MSGQPWERQGGEPSLWFDRFERFRLLGPTRSVLAVYNEEAEREGAKRRNGVPRAWTGASQGWNWRLRAEAWDEAQRQAAREFDATIRQQGYASQQARIDELNDILTRAKNTILARAADPENHRFAGGNQGLIVRSPVMVKEYAEKDDGGLVSTKRTILVEEGKVDAGLMREIREYLRHMAVERGEWAEKREHSGPGGKPIEVEHRDGFDFAAYHGLFGAAGAPDRDGDRPVDADGAAEYVDPADADA